eukprot:3583040-Pleurochrysis_carterae.AAC.5
MTASECIPRSNICRRTPCPRLNQNECKCTNMANLCLDKDEAEKLGQHMNDNQHGVTKAAEAPDARSPENGMTMKMVMCFRREGH